MIYLVLFILAVIVFVVVYTFAKFRMLMVAYKPTNVEKALQHVADLIAQRTKLEERIVELEEELSKE